MSLLKKLNLIYLFYSYIKNFYEEIGRQILPLNTKIFLYLNRVNNGLQLPGKDRSKLRKYFFNLIFNIDYLILDSKLLPQMVACKLSSLLE
jgi:hypothetical protein